MKLWTPSTSSGFMPDSSLLLITASVKATTWAIDRDSNSCLTIGMLIGVIENSRRPRPINMAAA